MLVLIPVSGFAFSNPSVSIVCTGMPLAQPIEVGARGLITAVPALEIPNGQSLEDFEVRMTIESVIAADAARGDITPKASVEVYKLKDMLSGTFMQLQSAKGNRLSLDAVFMEMGPLEVSTAGPIPEGVHDLKISLALLSSNLLYKNPSPMTVEKRVFDCKATVRY